MIKANDPSVHSVMKKFVDEAAAGGVTNGTLKDTRQYIYKDEPGPFRAFYELTRDWLLPRHAYKAVDNIYTGRERNQRAGWECFRGGTKTSTITEGFTLYRIGLKPEHSNLFVQASDAQATKHAKNVAHHIANNPMFKALFPNVVPDANKGWSNEGFWVKDASKHYGEWTRIRSKDPTLVGAGYTAKIVVGSHPTGVFVIDDINNDENTESARLSEQVNRIVRDTLFPMIMPSTWSLFNQTPWTYQDALAYVKSTGVYDFVRTPVLEWVEEGTEGAVYWERFDQWLVPTWPEMFDLQTIELKYRESGHIGFARMYLLDLEAAKGQTLKREWLGRFPHDQIDPTWPQFIGLDYASTSDRQKHRAVASESAICWGCVSPGGTLIVQDGINEQMSQQATYQRLFSAVQLLPRLQQIGIEQIGKGEEFVELIRMAPVWLPLMPISSHTGLDRSKPSRYERVLAPAFQRGDIMLSDRQTEFLKAFEDDWVAWNGDPKQSRTDLLDAVHLMAKAAEGYIRIPQQQPNPAPSWREPDLQEVSHPFSGIRDHDGH